ncbi:MAG TPA: FliM/FliN family flagellar motor C-terminal domain-containing protein [Candidatus Rubrimentiphilum sp.]|nr:FliM/FliN family flagellar motor C-terminal domain-containing protein [Candidatus Rubrimentiphilum sp.]
MNVLGFERSARVAGGRCVRDAIFVRRSLLPVAAACLVANAARETLSELLGTVTLRLFEPLIPNDAAWRCIASGAEIFAVRGSVADAAFVLRSDDALSLAGAAFGERMVTTRAMSPLEAELLARIVGALCGTLTPVCGARADARIERLTHLTGFVTYFELLLEEPVEARIGVALSREPVPQAVPSLGIAHLEDIELDLAVEIAHGFLPAPALLSLRRGDVVKLDSRLADRAIVRAGENVIARGECGDLNGRSVVILQ